MNNKSIQVVLLGLATVFLLLVSNGVSSYAQTTYSNQTAGSNTFSSTANTTGTNATSLPSNPVAKNIDEGIKAIKADDKSAGKKALLHAESSLEGKSDSVDAEKHVEAAIQALKEGDNNVSFITCKSCDKSLGFQKKIIHH